MSNSLGIGVENSAFSRQKGFGPVFTMVTGLLLSVYFLYVLIRYFITLFAWIAQHGAASIMTGGSILFILVQVLIYLILIYIGYTLMSFYPAVRLTGEGIEARTLFLTNRVRWEDVESLFELLRPKGAHDVIFYRKGSSALRLLWDNFIIGYADQTHGFFTGIHDPVIILSKGLENRQQILAEIEKHLPDPQSIKNKRATSRGLPNKR